MFAAMLIRAFATRTKLPVQVQEVAEFIIKARVTDEVNYIGVDINTRILKGMNHATKAVRKPGLSAMADPHYCHDIYTAKSLTVDETRLVQTKELLHILDPDAFKTATGAEFEKMIQGVVLPPGTLSVVKNGIQAAWDMGSITAASAVLLPLAARNLLLPKLDEGKLTIAEIAGMADIPIDSVKVVMSPRWEEIYDGLINLNWPEQPKGPDPSGET